MADGRYAGALRERGRRVAKGFTLKTDNEGSTIAVGPFLLVCEFRFFPHCQGLFAAVENANSSGIEQADSNETDVLHSAIRCPHAMLYFGRFECLICEVEIS